jgi:serine/threonine-protein kinase
MNGFDDAPELVGTLFNGRYEVGRTLSSGSFGWVYEARDTRIMDRPVALKILKYDQPRQRRYRDETVKSFQRETGTMGLLRDPGTVVLYEAGVGTTQGGLKLLYMSMEYIHGVTLSDYLKANGRIPALELAGMLSSIAKSLQEAHHHGMIHRDLKPANVMLTRDVGGDERVKVLDFGIAKAFKSGGALDMNLTQTGFIKGTPRYMAPEQATADSEDFGEWTDIYALGVMAYECLTGRNPYGHINNPTKILRELIVGEVITVPAPYDTSGLAPIINKMVHRERDQRYQNCTDLLADLRELKLLGEEHTRPVSDTAVTAVMNKVGAPEASGSAGPVDTAPTREQPIKAHAPGPAAAPEAQSVQPAQPAAAASVPSTQPVASSGGGRRRAPLVALGLVAALGLTAALMGALWSDPAADDAGASVPVPVAAAAPPTGATGTGTPAERVDPTPPAPTHALGELVVERASNTSGGAASPEADQSAGAPGAGDGAAPEDASRDEKADEPAVKPEAKSKAKPAVKPEAKPKAKPEAEPKPEPKPEAEAKPEAKPEAEPNEDPVEETAARPEAKPADAGSGEEGAGAPGEFFGVH